MVGDTSLTGVILGINDARPSTHIWWTCRVFVLLQVLVHTTFRSNAIGLFQPSAECSRRGL